MLPETHCVPRSQTRSWLHHSVGSHRRLQPSRCQNKSTVTQRLISADIHKICGEHASVCYRIVAMALGIWKHSRVSMTLPRQLGWLGETSQASWCIFPRFLKKALLATLPPSLPLCPSSFFQACPQFSSLVFCPNETFFPPSSINQIVQVHPPPPRRPLRTNWAL